MRSQVQPFRRATSIAARIVLGDGTALPCLIENLSMGGAKILMDAESPMPEAFRVVAEELSLSQEAEIAWRTGGEMGIRFRNRPPVGGAARQRR